MDEKEIIQKIKNNPNCIETITGGFGRDDDVHNFWDYVYTLNRMKEILIDYKFKPSFTIISDKQTKIECNNSEHCKPIIREVPIDLEFSYEDLEDLKFYTTKKNIYLSEFEYLISRDWIKEWIVEEIEEDFHYLQLKKEEYFVSTGNYYSLRID